MTCEQGDLQKVGVAGARGKVPHLHVLDHALPKDCHGKLRCEMECAALSAPSCRNRSLSMMQEPSHSRSPTSIQLSRPCRRSLPRSGLVQCRIWDTSLYPPGTD